MAEFDEYNKDFHELTEEERREAIKRKFEERYGDHQSLDIFSACKVFSCFPSFLYLYENRVLLICTFSLMIGSKGRIARPCQVLD